MRYWLFFIGLFVLAPALQAKLRIGVQLEGQAHVEQFINGRAIESIQDYSGPLAYRDVVEQVLLMQALHFGGYKGEIEFVQADHYQRRLRLLEQGLLDLSVTPIWYTDAKEIQQHVHISSPLLKPGDAEAGFYVHESNHSALSVSHLQELKQLSAISNDQWQVDWRIMKSIGFNQLYNVSQFTQMTDMISKKRADVMLAAFYNTPDLSFIQDGQRFVPIPGFKVKLPGSRHFVVSNKCPNNQAVFNALETGLTILRENGLIYKAYVQSGFINESVNNWELIR